MLKGIISSLLASVLFGYLYYFSTLLVPLNGEDIFGYRIIFTAPAVIFAVFLFRQKYALINHFKRIQRQPWLLAVFLCNGAMMGFQMWLFLWAPNHGSALSVSLGYLLLPLSMVAVGWLVFKEHISLFKFLAVAVAAIGVLSNILIKGGLSWESLAVSGYTVYFAVRKRFKIADLSAFAIEIILILPVCIYLAAQTDLEQVRSVNPNILWLLVILGLISGVALNAYILAANLLPVNLLGLLGYVEPIMMLGVAMMLGENIDTQTYPLFLCLLIAMGLIMIDGIKTLKKRHT